MHKPIKRRNFLIRAGGSAFIFGTSSFLSTKAATAWDQDRPFLSQTREAGVTCDNAGVPVSSLSERKSTLTDFDTANTCKLTDASVEGPYFICAGANTSKDITGGFAGQPLIFALRVLDQSCMPVPGAVVDIWGCDANGVYSGFEADPDEEYRGGVVDITLPTRELRGTLATDVDGIVEFDTIYPGFYAGRAIHIHFKVHVENKVYLTSQALFPESINSRVLAQSLYAAPRDTPRLLNIEDPKFIGELGTVQIADRGSALLSTMNLTIT